KRQTPDELKNSYGLGFSVNKGSFGHGGAMATDMTIDVEHGLVLVWCVQHAGFPGNGGQARAAFQKAAIAEVAGKGTSRRDVSVPCPRLCVGMLQGITHAPRQAAPVVRDDSKQAHAKPWAWHTMFLLASGELLRLSEHRGDGIGVAGAGCFERSRAARQYQ